MLTQVNKYCDKKLLLDRQKEADSLEHLKKCSDDNNPMQLEQKSSSLEIKNNNMNNNKNINLSNNINVRYNQIINHKHPKNNKSRIFEVLEEAEENEIEHNKKKRYRSDNTLSIENNANNIAILKIQTEKRRQSKNMKIKNKRIIYCYQCHRKRDAEYQLRQN
jgi:hypothetical protein